MKKLYLVISLLFFSFDFQAKDPKTIILNSSLLRAADNAGIFHGPMIDILQSRIDFVNLVQGEKQWNGVIMKVNIADTDNTLTIYCRRPEIICGATFVVITPDHELANKIITPTHKNTVQEYMNSKAFITNKMQSHQTNLYQRQMNSDTHGVFTGSYAINPFTQEKLPIYISDYAIECFDIRHSKARLCVPAHNSKDLEFARIHKLPIKLVVDVQKHLSGKKDNLGPVVAAPLLDKDGNLTEAYLGEYSACVIVNSNTLDNASLKDAAAHVLDYLEENNCGTAHSELLQYNYNNQLYSIKDLAKIETALFKNATDNAQVLELKKDLKIALNYAQADFLEIGEKFLINVKNTKTLMIALIEESCAQRENNNCYLLRWSQLKGEFNEKEIFRRDITSIRDFTLFCKDLVNFLGDLAHSCPKALENIKKQNQ